MKSIKTKCIPLALGFALLLPSVVAAADTAPVQDPSIMPSEVVFHLNGTDLTVNGKVTVMDVMPTQKDGFTYVPLRYAAEAIGATVTWDDVNRAAVIKWNNKTASITVGTDEVLINGEKKTASANTIMLGERAMVPVSVFAEVTGWRADLADEGKTIRFLVQ